MCCAAQQSGGAAIVREGQVAVAAHGPGVSRLPPQLGLADGDGTTRLQSRSHRTLGPARYRGGDSTACRCSFKSRVRQVDTSLKGELDLRRIPDGNCQGNSRASIGVQARVTHDSPRGHKSEEGFFRCVTRRPATGLPGCLRWHSEFRRQSWIELKMRFSDSCGFHCSGLRCASLGLRPVRTNSLPKSGFLRQLCRTGVLPEVPLERPCSPGIRPNGLFHQGTRFRTITPATFAHVKRNNPEHQQAVRRRKR